MKFICSLILLALLTGAARADVKVASIFGSHMVLQREVVIPVWGTAAPGEQVAVSLGDATATAVANANGKWQVKLPARPAAETPVDLVVTGTNKVTLHDVLVGDVWIAAGQSNMDWAFFWGNGVLNTDAEMAAADYPLIRDCKVTTGANVMPQDDLRGSWIVCTPKTPGMPKFSSGIEHFTATGYFFARELFHQVKIPIGLINSSDGGTQIESWLDPETARKFPAIDARWQEHVAAYPAAQAKYDAAKSAWDSAKAAGQTAGKMSPMAPASEEKDILRPSGLYNAMIHPFLRFAFKGAIWYQGENNVKRAAEYRELFPALITGWRREFGRGDFPFYWAQLSNYDFNGANATQWAYLREAQTTALSLPNTGQAITLDIGDPGNVHLHNKQEVGRRLSLLALRRVYGMKDVVDSGPILDHADLSGNPVRIYFRNAEGGLKYVPIKSGTVTVPAAATATLGGFEVAGSDQVFHPAEARIDARGACVTVTCGAVPKPLAVRYAWRNDPKNLALANNADLPAAPFRTDDWPENPAELQGK